MLRRSGLLASAPPRARPAAALAPAMGPSKQASPLAAPSSTSGMERSASTGRRQGFLAATPPRPESSASALTPTKRTHTDTACLSPKASTTPGGLLDGSDAAVHTAPQQHPLSLTASRVSPGPKRRLEESIAYARNEAKWADAARAATAATSRTVEEDMRRARERLAAHKAAEQEKMQQLLASEAAQRERALAARRAAEEGKERRRIEIYALNALLRASEEARCAQMVASLRGGGNLGGILPQPPAHSADGPTSARTDHALLTSAMTHNV